MSVLHAGDTLRPGARLVSPHGAAYAIVTRSGRLAVDRADGQRVWATAPRNAASPRLYVGGRGDVVLADGTRRLWSTGTAGSGRADTLRLTDAGTLVLRAGRLPVWSSRTGNLCRAGGPKRLVVDLSRQLMAACVSTRQVRATPVTSGAVDLGRGTPTGTYRVQGHTRDTTLYPAAGGAYPVKYWMPYDGAYGMHDSPWQHFPYGSRRYRTEGSHGCVHVPPAMMAWVFRWAVTGTQVTIHG